MASPATATHAVPRWALVGATLVLFLVWSNTFLAFEVLLAPRTGPAPCDWYGLTLLRFVPAAAAGLVWCFAAHRRESVAIVRAHPLRLLACGLCVVPAYNGFLYHGMQHRVQGPVASIVTTLTPLYLVAMGAFVLGERLTRRKAAALALGLLGLVLIATAKDAAGSRAVHVAEVALAPLAWSVYSILTKQVMHERSPILWTYLAVSAGTLLLLPGLLFLPAPDVAALDPRGLALVAYLAFVATLGGFAVWNWLLRHLPAGTVGLTVFLNPPLTLASKCVLAALLPASFALVFAPQEWLGGAVMLAGVATAVLPAPGYSPNSRRSIPS